MSKSPKEKAAIFAAEKLKDELFIIFGSGSTVDLIISQLTKVHQSLNDLKVISGSSSTSKQLFDNSIQEITISDMQHLIGNSNVICVDGADEIVFDTRQQAQVILKGHGAALLREKILWDQGQKILIVVDETKVSPAITKYVPIEVIPFAVDTIISYLKINFPGVNIKIRKSEDQTPLITDNQNYIVEFHHNGTISDFYEFHHTIKQITGVVETGIFGDKYIEKASYIIGYEDRVEYID